jgi:hypothetical protein
MDDLWKEKVHGRSLNLSSSNKIIPQSQNRIQHILQLTKPMQTTSLDGFDPVSSDMAAESAWDPRGPHVTGATLAEFLFLLLSLSYTLFSRQASRRWGGGHRGEEVAATAAPCCRRRRLTSDEARRRSKS